MVESAGMRVLLDLEDAAPDVLFEQVGATGAYFWPLARWPVSRAIAETDVGTTLPVYATPTPLQRLKRAAIMAIPNPYSTANAPRQVENLFMVNGRTRIPTPHGFVNWLTDDFAAALGSDAIVVQDVYTGTLNPPQNRPLLRATTFSYSRALDRIENRARRNPLDERVERSLRDAMDEVFRLLPFEVSGALRERATTDALGRARRVPHADREFSRLLDRVQPRRIYMQTAAYGPRSSQIRLAHERGIAVSELQHGWIGSSHAAYNFGSAMHADPLVGSLPDTLLTFGEFWGQDIRFPGTVVPIGKPSFEHARRAAPPFAERTERVLFVLSNYLPDEVKRVVRQMRTALPGGWTIALRPHPVERTTVGTIYADELALPGIELDGIDDAHASMADSRAVVGFSSTMLYEALALDCHVAVIESVLGEHYANPEIFPLRIHDDESVEAAVRSFRGAPTVADRALGDRVWKPDPVRHFLSEAAR